eukprot:TRINITY_DN11246_c0_g1_i3.p1 TRINITY_DN11246_c0_g1~~TRINITY_DN11246_c0_g1_i3.p1  ORF type:complete len:296 (-),score=62.30 TRINITY_DN11246_c0_g1_i3:38-925(-)
MFVNTEATTENQTILFVGSVRCVQETDTYTGTFTSPPCHHSVAWIILSKPVKISDQTLSQFQALWAGNTKFAGGTGNYRNLQVLHKHTKIILGTVQKELHPLDISEQIYNEEKKEDTDSEQFYQKQIQKNLQILEKQRIISSYTLKAKDKLKYLQKKLNILTTQYNEQLANSNGEDLSQFQNQVIKAQNDLNHFQSTCLQYSDDSDCNLEIPTQQLQEPDEQSEQQQIQPGDKKEAIEQSQELSGTNFLKPEEQVMRTHDGQEVTIKVPEDLQFCLLYTSPSPRDRQKSRMPSSA